LKSPAVIAEIAERTALFGITVQHVDHDYSRPTNFKFGNFADGKFEGSGSVYIGG